MDVFSFIVLENTLDELTTRATRCNGNSRLDECVTVIRACMQLTAMDPTNEDYTQKLRHALTELSQIARQHGEYIVAARLKTIAYQVTSSDQLEHRLTRTARTEL
jgi:hypothetical protein